MTKTLVPSLYNKVSGVAGYVKNFSTDVGGDDLAGNVKEKTHVEGDVDDMESW